MDPRIARARGEMERRLQEPLALADLAGAARLSPSRFARLFRADVGVPPARYLHQLRLARARVLLERTFLTVKQVRTLVGLNDGRRFSRDFRRAYGIGPGALRRQGWVGSMRRGTPPPAQTDDGE
jgi:AraC family transcriptional regulator, arabinose operon regulatory protein